MLCCHSVSRKGLQQDKKGERGHHMTAAIVLLIISSFVLSGHVMICQIKSSLLIWHTIKKKHSWKYYLTK